MRALVRGTANSAVTFCYAPVAPVRQNAVYHLDIPVWRQAMLPEGERKC
jgi:hypothetical protein